MSPAMLTETHPDEARILTRLDALGIAHSTMHHPPVFTVAEADAAWSELAGLHVKNLFLKDRDGTLWLLSCRAELRVALQQLAKAVGAARFSFGSAELLLDKLGVTPGSVTPLALAADRRGEVRFLLDAALARAPLVNVHPLHNGATTGISGADLVRFAAASGHPPHLVSVPVQEEAAS